MKLLGRLWDLGVVVVVVRVVILSVVRVLSDENSGIYDGEGLKMLRSLRFLSARSHIA